mmetsp:Transcript_89461/g.175082  ORF Transcript_89461/g.175082 Transcript_89461/m.175082 type:complete len:278 (-) Transcript_89461:1011-1844(-)
MQDFHAVQVHPTVQLVGLGRGVASQVQRLLYPVTSRSGALRVGAPLLFLVTKYPRPALATTLKSLVGDEAVVVREISVAARKQHDGRPLHSIQLGANHSVGLIKRGDFANQGVVLHIGVHVPLDYVKRARRAIDHCVDAAQYQGRLHNELPVDAGANATRCGLEMNFHQVREAEPLECRKQAKDAGYVAQRPPRFVHCWHRGERVELRVVRAPYRNHIAMIAENLAEEPAKHTGLLIAHDLHVLAKKSLARCVRIVAFGGVDQRRDTAVDGNLRGSE